MFVDGRLEVGLNLLEFMQVLVGEGLGLHDNVGTHLGIFVDYKVLMIQF
jgi:hypothetical protein